MRDINLKREHALVFPLIMFFSLNYYNLFGLLIALFKDTIFQTIPAIENIIVSTNSVKNNEENSSSLMQVKNASNADIE